MKRLYKRLWGWILCKIFDDHDWTSNFRKGIKPNPIPKGATPEEIEQLFWEYSRIWCDRCGEPSKFNKV